MSDNPHEGHRERLRTLFEKGDIDSFSDHNILELALFYILPRKDTNVIAHDLMNKFGSFSEVLDAPVERLQEVKNVGRTTALFIKLIKEMHRHYQNDRMKKKDICGHEAMVEYAYTMLSNLTEEHVLLISVDNKMRMIHADMLCEGSVNSAALSTRAVINSALIHNAVGVILAHNHPRGYALPSREDLQTTKIINDALKTISVKLIDHVICTPTEKNSLASCEQLEYLFR